MKKLKYKIGDIVIGVKNYPDFPEEHIKGAVGVIIDIYEDCYPYLIKFSKKVDFDFNEEHEQAYLVELAENQIKLINKIKLKALLKD